MTDQQIQCNGLLRREILKSQLIKLTTTRRESCLPSCHNRIANDTLRMRP